MFGMNNNKDKKPGSPVTTTLPSGSDATTVIAKGTLIEGKFSCTENVRLDGAIHGEVRVDKKMVMGDTGYVQGNIWAKEASIKGRIKGDIHVKEALHLLDTAIIEGNITARTMTVDEGARYNGACKIGTTDGSAKANAQANANV
jgi:cytoskeletal protein CcmA (bactofilin family)